MTACRGTAINLVINIISGLWSGIRTSKFQSIINSGRVIVGIKLLEKQIENAKLEN